MRIRIYLSGDQQAIDARFASGVLGKLADHVHACEPKAAALMDQPCRFIVIEDFNTTGLRGDPERVWEPKEGERRGEEFYYFFRAEGRSSKTGADRGNWGVGKYTFPATSAINTFFGLTVRTPDTLGEVGPLAFGQSVLRNHALGETRYKPDGWWAEFVDVDGSPVPVPYASASPAVEEIRRLFSITRVNEPGLSLAVPFVDASLDIFTVREAVLKNYSVAIAQGIVAFTIETPERSYDFDESNLEVEIKAIPDRSIAGVQEDVAAATWAKEASEEDWLVLSLSLIHI